MTLRRKTSDVKIPNFDFNLYATMIHDTTDPYEQMSMNDPERMPDIFPLRGASHVQPTSDLAPAGFIIY